MKLEAAFRNFNRVVEEHVEEMQALRKGTLQEFFMSRAARDTKTWGRSVR